MVEEAAVEHSASSMEINAINFLDERNTKTAENKSTASGEVSTGNPRLKYGVSMAKTRTIKMGLEISDKYLFLPPIYLENGLFQ